MNTKDDVNEVGVRESPAVSNASRRDFRLIGERRRKEHYFSGLGL